MGTKPRRLYPTLRTPQHTIVHIEIDQTYRVALEGMRTSEAFHLAAILADHPVFAEVGEAIFNEIARSDYDADAVQVMATAGEGDQSPEVQAA
ncbi:MAG: hypothetical protein WBA46_19480 [Thermomicrobiales bacterium]